MLLKKPESRLAFGEVLGAPHQSAQTFPRSPATPVMEEPVLFLHIREHPGKALRKMGLVVVKGGIDPACKIMQGAFAEFSLIGRQEMIVDHIHYGPAVEAVVRPEYLLCFAGRFMRISKGINGPVQTDAPLNFCRVIELFPPFHIIADHIAHEYARVVEREICVCEVIDKAMF